MNSTEKKTLMSRDLHNNGLYAEMQVYRARMSVSPANLDALLEAMYIMDNPTGSWEDVETGEAWIEAFGISLKEVEATAREMAEIAESVDGIPHAADVEPLAKEDWTESWKRFFHVLHITNRITVRPIWEEYSPAEGEIVIDIEPGMSFGTGIHQTTQSCIKLLQQLAEEGSLERSVIDMGCGSGILAIAARKLGFNHVSGYDYDPSAVKTAIENSATNGLKIPFHEGDALAPVLPSADIFVANILAPILLQAASSICDAVSTHKGHALVLSGILDNQYADVKAAYAAQGFIERNSILDGEWRSGLFARPS